MSIRIEQFKVKNQFVFTDTETGEKFLQSYDSIIVKKHKGKITIGKNWNCSKTTSKYRNLFLGESTKETQAKLDSGEYEYDENL